MIGTAMNLSTEMNWAVAKKLPIQFITNSTRICNALAGIFHMAVPTKGMPCNVFGYK